MTINGLDLNNPKQKIFFTSDLHFCHKGVMSFHPRFRDFKSVGAMDNALINMWNSTVGDDDVVFNLGDFCFGDFEVASKIASKLKGKHILIYGNHDSKIKRQEIKSLNKVFFATFDYLRLDVSRNGERFSLVLFHYPIFEWDRSHYGAFHLYGHVHDADLSEFLGERSLNICYDSLGRMIELGEVLSTLKRGKIKPCVHNDFMDDE